MFVHADDDSLPGDGGREIKWKEYGSLNRLMNWKLRLALMIAQLQIAL